MRKADQDAIVGVFNDIYSKLSAVATAQTDLGTLVAKLQATPDDDTGTGVDPTDTPFDVSQIKGYTPAPAPQGGTTGTDTPAPGATGAAAAPLAGDPNL